MYQALYRKWRPRTFSDVVGQEHITETLKNQVISHHLSHAYLFIGTRGTGKTSCAKILAKAVNCESPVNGNPCNRCAACRGIDDGSVLDVVEIDAASNNGVDNVRALRDEAIFSPAMVSKRVYIIDEVHMLSLSAFNALLKILEEPPEHLMFILATTELHKVPATILSRCQRHSFKRLDSQAISGRLQYVAEQEQLNLSAEAAALIAQLSEGGMRDALSLLDQCSGRQIIEVETVYSAIGLAGRHKITRLLTLIAAHNTPEALTQFQTLWQEGKDPATLLGELSSLLRDILIRKVAPGGSSELLSSGYDEQTLDQFTAQLTSSSLIHAINTIQDTLGNMRNGQAKTLCELCLITLSEPDLSDSLPQLNERLARLEQAIDSGAITHPVLPPTEQKREPLPISRSPQTDGRLSAEDAPPFDLAPAKPTPTPMAPAAKPVQAVTVNPPSAAPASADWETVLKALNKNFPGGLLALLSDPSSTTATVEQDQITLQLHTSMANNMLNRPDTLERIGHGATQALGRPMTVRASDGKKVTDTPVPVAAPAQAAAAPAVNKPTVSMPPVQAEQENKTAYPVLQTGNLDELSKFDIVTFK